MCEREKEREKERERERETSSSKKHILREEEREQRKRETNNNIFNERGGLDQTHKHTNTHLHTRRLIEKHQTKRRL